MLTLCSRTAKDAVFIVCFSAILRDLVRRARASAIGRGSSQEGEKRQGGAAGGYMPVFQHSGQKVKASFRRLPTLCRSAALCCSVAFPPAHGMVC